MAATTLSVTFFMLWSFTRRQYITIAHGSHRLHGFFRLCNVLSTTEMTDFTDFVSIACSLRY